MLIGTPLPLANNPRLPELNCSVFDDRWAECLLNRVYLDGDGPVLFGAYPSRACPGMDGRGCSKRAAAMCSMCLGDGVVQSGKPLALWGCFDAHGHPEPSRRDELKMSWDALLKEALLRAPSTQALTDGWSTADGTPQVAIRARLNKPPTVTATFPMERKRRAGVLLADDVKTCLLLRAVRKYADGRYANILVNKVYVSKAANSTAKYVVYVRGMGSSYCLFHRGDHEADLVYFVVNRDGIAQHCPCCNFRPKPQSIQLSENGKRVLNLPYSCQVGGDFMSQLREKILPAFDAFRNGHVDELDVNGTSKKQRRR